MILIVIVSYAVCDDALVSIVTILCFVQVVNSSLVEQQIEAGLLWSLAQATFPSPEWVAGMPRARPIGGLGLPRLGEAPQIAPHFAAERFFSILPIVGPAVRDILRNAAIFHERWGWWPMSGWLQDFARQGLIRFEPASQTWFSRMS